jgi:hypothetical protein
LALVVIFTLPVLVNPEDRLRVISTALVPDTGTTKGAGIARELAIAAPLIISTISEVMLLLAIRLS